MDRKMLFTPGPVMTSAETKAALMHPDMPHRRPAFERVFNSARARLVKLLGADDSYTCVLVTGSGSAANECALSSLVRPAEEAVVVHNGPFADRLVEILRCYGVKVHLAQTPWGVLPDLAALERMLVGNPRISWVCSVWHETGSGMRNPVKAINEVARKHGRRTFVDAVSAFGGEDIHVLRDEIDVVTSVGNKAVGGMTGIAFVLARRSTVPALGPDMPRRNMYLNLQSHMKWADEHNQTPNTPAVTMIVGFDHALKELTEETLPGRIRRYQACAKVIRDGARQMGLKLLLPDEQFSNTVTSIFLPPGIGVDDFIEALDERGYVVYPGKGIYHEQNVFQIANMGRITPEDCRTLLRVVGETIELMRQGKKSA
ncbi:MAG: aminotransferase class V-fold PLP-dependent enzyme [Myxococcota bacterium]